MIKKPTVLVLGAGASAPYNFPQGERLLDTICSQLESAHSPAAQDIVSLRFTDVAIRDFARRLKASGRFSIDEFLQWHPQDKELGKLAIARVLAPLESDAALDPHAAISPKIPDRRWYRYFLDALLTSSSGRCSLQSNSLSVITFNFDRSFERALFRFAEANCGVDGGPIARMVTQIPVYHIHGRLGAPAWLPEAGWPLKGEPARLYGGGDIREQALLEGCAAAIRIVDDEVEHSDVLKFSKAALNEAEQICFLGFRYYPLSLKKLTLGVNFRGKVIKGTAFEMAQGPRGAVQDAFARISDSGIQLSPVEDDILAFLKNTEVLYE